MYMHRLSKRLRCVLSVVFSRTGLNRFVSCSTVDEAENNLKNIKEEEGRSILIN